MQTPEPLDRPASTQRGGAQLTDMQELGPNEERVIELREEQLVVNKELHEIGEVIIRKKVESVPAQLEVEALREEVEVQHEPVGQAVSQREDPREEDGVLIVPVYEEQLVVSKRLILRERLHVRRVATAERQVFQDTVQREHLVVEDPQESRLIKEIYPADDAHPPEEARADSKPGTLRGLIAKALE
jgi:uncharacterized protein (TIGR02271 family)